MSLFLNLFFYQVDSYSKVETISYLFLYPQMHDIYMEWALRMYVERNKIKTHRNINSNANKH